MAVVLQCPLQWYFWGMGSRATWMASGFEGFDLIVESMFPSLKYTGHLFLTSELLVRCVWSELPNVGTMAAPSGRRSAWSGQTHCSYLEIELMYLFKPPPDAWFHLWLDMFLSIIQFLCWSKQHMFPECRLLHEELIPFNRIAVKETCVIIVAKVVWIDQMIIAHFAGFPRVDVHRVEHFMRPFE